MRWLRGILPFLLYACIGVFVYWYMQSEQHSFKMTTAMENVGKVPEFSLPRVGHPDQLISRHDIEGRPALINIGATWCFSCRVEHSFLVSLAGEGVPVYGVDYKEKDFHQSNGAEKWNQPYVLALSDRKGKLTDLLGVTDLPETLLIDEAGRIRFRHAGALSQYVWKNVMQPRYQMLVRAKEKREKS